MEVNPQSIKVHNAHHSSNSSWGAICPPEIKFRAERRLGEMISAQKESAGLASGGQPYQSTGSNLEPVERPPTLAEAGIDKKLSSRAQKMTA